MTSYRENWEYQDKDGRWRKYERETTRRGKLRRSRNGLIFGVCQGFSNWSGISVGIIRAVVIISMIFTGFFPVGFAYLVLALIMPVERY